MSSLILGYKCPSLILGYKLRTFYIFFPLFLMYNNEDIKSCLSPTWDMLHVVQTFSKGLELLFSFLHPFPLSLICNDFLNFHLITNPKKCHGHSIEGFLSIFLFFLIKDEILFRSPSKKNWVLGIA